MARILAKVGNLDVVSTQKILFYGNEQLTIFPFDDDPDYGVRFDVLIEEDPAAQFNVSIEIKADEYPKIKLKRPFKTNTPSANAQRIVIAIDDKYKYSISYLASLVGTHDQYVVALDYTIFREKVDG